MNKPWHDFIDADIRRILTEKLQFPHMALVQSVTLPIMMDRSKDVCVEACTGSGKSLAFIIPILQHLIHKQKTDRSYNKHYTGALILSPTRELTQQLAGWIDKFLVNEPLGQRIQSWTLVGGRNSAYDVQRYQKEGANLIVSTPGRLNEVLDRCPLLATQLKKSLDLLVLDEADLLLQMGFESTLNKIFAYLPKQRRTCLFSATLTKRVDMLIRVGMRNPVRIEVKSKNPTQSTSKGVPKSPKSSASDSSDQSGAHLNHAATESLLSTGLHISPFLTNYEVIIPTCMYKLPFLIHFLNQHPTTKVLVFVATCAQVNLYSHLIRPQVDEQMQLMTLHRKVRQKRTAIFEQFQQCTSGCALLCTDVMSRGIDIPKIDWVVNFDLPNDLQTFIHRSGRSGHCVGVQGNSLTVCLPHEHAFVELCQRNQISFQSFDCDFASLDESRDLLVAEMKQRARTDALFYQSVMKAFVSFLRTYSTKNIISATLFAALDVADLANSYALLKIPHMPELSGKLKGIATRLQIDDGDAQIAKDHKKVLDARKPGKVVTEQQQKRKLLGKKIKKMKGDKRRDFVRQLEFDELQSDVRMLKKAKRKKISEQELEEHLGI